MKVLSKTAVALAMGAVATQPAQPLSPFIGLNPRDRQTAEDYERLCGELKTRMANLDKLITRYDDGLKRLDGVPDDLKNELEVRAKENKKLAGEIEELQQKLIEGVQSRDADPHTVASLLIRNKEVADQANSIVRARGKFGLDGVLARNIVTLAGMGKTASLAKNDLSRTVERPLTILDWISFTPITAELVPLLQESAYEIMAEIVSESLEKPESELNFGVVDLKAGTIAHLISISLQTMADMPTLAAYIEGRLAYGVRLKLEAYIVAGDGVTAGTAKSFSGLLESGNHETVTAEKDDTAIDVISRAKYKAGATGLQPEAIILNPEDWGKIERIKGSDGHYIFGSPGAAVQPVLWGLPVVLSAAMTLGKYWVGNVSLGIAGFIREDVAVELSTEDKDNFRKNLGTLRAEMRACCGVQIPDACVAGELPVITAVIPPVAEEE